MHQDQIDAILREICERSQLTVEQFLEATFSFLRRRSDFYHIKKNPNEVKGFAQGEAERIVIEQFNKQWKLKHEEELKTVPEENTEPSTPSPHPKMEGKLPPAMFINTMHGGHTDRYHWGQNYEAIEVEIPLAEPVLRNDVSVKFGARYVTLLVSSNSQVHLEFAEEPLYPILPQECNWQLEHKKVKSTGQEWFAVTLYLAKDAREVRDRMWEHVFLTDARFKIDAQKIPIRKTLDELPESDRDAAFRAMEDHSRKMRGLPTSEEMKTMELVKDAWVYPGSPMQGPPTFDDVFRRYRQL